MKSIFRILLLVCLANGVNAQDKRETVLFDYDKSALTSEAKLKLDALVSRLDMKTLSFVTLYGNTDADGNAKYNVELSKNRNKTVSDYLVSKGIPATKIKLEFYGENKPVAQNSVASGKQLNRRVELIFEFAAKEFDNVIFQKLETETQNFEGKSNEEIVITGKQGTKITIPKNSLMKENGKYAVGKINLELMEFYKKSDVVLANLHSMSDNAMLESGGMIYISATNNGEKLQLKNNAKMTIEFASKNNKSDMQVFYGHPKGKEINWNTNEPGGTSRWTRYSRNSVSDTLLSEGIETKYFKRDGKSAKQITALDKTILTSARLGWINCDRFYDEKNKTELLVTMDLKYKPEIRLVFKDINSVMAANVDKDNRFVFNNIPVGRKATLVAFSSVDEQTYLVMKEVTIEKGNPIGLELEKTTLDDFKEQLIKLN